MSDVITVDLRTTSPPTPISALTSLPSLRMTRDGTGLIIRIVHISDTHNKAYPNIPHGDVLCHTGDFTDNGTEDEFKEFTKWFSALSHPHKIVICGNHEFGHDPTNMATTKSWLGPGITYLQDSGIELFGCLRVWGTPWNNIYGCGHAFGVVPEYRKYKMDLIPATTDVLMTHNPPWLIMDKASGGDAATTACQYCSKSHPYRTHWGCPAISAAIQQKKIHLHLFGHVHEDNGVQAIGETTYSNGAMDLHHKFHVFDVIVPISRLNRAVPLTPSPFGSVINRRTGLCLDIDYGKKEPGTSVIYYQVVDSRPKNQMWFVNERGYLASGLDTNLGIILKGNKQLVTATFTSNPQERFLFLDWEGRLTNGLCEIRIDVPPPATPDGPPSGPPVPQIVANSREGSLTHENAWILF